MKAVQTKHITDAEILAAIRCREQNPSLPFPDGLLADKYPAKVVLNKMAQMVQRGILNYGVTLRSAWIEKGGTV